MRTTSAIVLALCACGGSTSSSKKPDASTTPTADASPNAPDATPGSPDARPGTPDANPSAPDANPNAPDADVSGGKLGKGWLYTQGNHVYVADGAGGGSVWVGRGVNTDDLFLCGYNYDFWEGTDGPTNLKASYTELVKNWKPSFVRVSLGMDSYVDPSNNFPALDWLGGHVDDYQQPMTDAIHQLTGAGVYVLVTLRSDISMIDYWTGNDPEPTGIPSDSSTTPDPTNRPDGTDSTYRGIVDSFANDSHVLFGLSNEPGGNSQTNDEIRKRMDHAVGVIRAEEDRLGVPHHIVTVQGNGWTSDISFYATNPLAYDDVAYEVHGYTATPDTYTYANIPVIIGEYGPDANTGNFDDASFYADVESKQIPNLAWDFAPWSDCNPDLLVADGSYTAKDPWGTTVQKYLLAH